MNVSLELGADEDYLPDVLECGICSKVAVQNVWLFLF